MAPRTQETAGSGGTKVVAQRPLAQRPVPSLKQASSTSGAANGNQRQLQGCLIRRAARTFRSTPAPEAKGAPSSTGVPSSADQSPKEAKPPTQQEVEDDVIEEIPSDTAIIDIGDMARAELAAAANGPPAPPAGQQGTTPVVGAEQPAGVTPSLNGRVAKSIKEGDSADKPTPFPDLSGVLD